MARNALALATCVLVLAVTVGAQPRPLQPDTPVEASLAPTDSHEYVVTSRGNRAFDIVAEQRGLDVVLTVLGPAGEQLLQVDAAFDDQGRGGSEVAHVRALDAGTYRIRVVLFDRPDQKPGKYRITLTAGRDLSAEEVANARSEKDIAAIEARWEQAGDDMDLATYKSILRSDGFALGPYASETRTREQVIQGWENNAKERAKLGSTRKHTISEHVIRASGDTGVSTGRFVITSTTKDRESKFSGQFVHVWGRDKDGWKLVADYTFPFGRVPREKVAPISVAPDVLSAYAGTYREDHSPNVITVTVEKGALVSQWQYAGQEPFTIPLPAVTDTTFAGPNQTEVVFIRAPTGAVRELLVVGDGPAVRAVRNK
jgi:ketosteroid isomerase-like protein